MSKTYKGIAALRKLQNIVPRNFLLIIYTPPFIRPHTPPFIRTYLDYGDIIYHQPHNGSFCQKSEPIQYQEALAMTGAIQQTSQTKSYNELGIGSMKFRQQFRHLCYFFKIQSRGLPQYLNDLIRKSSLLPNFKVRIKFFRNYVFPYTLNERNNLGKMIKSSESYLTFRKRLFSLIRPKCNYTYGIHHPTMLKLLTLLRLGLSDLNDHKFNQNFTECINTLCSRSLRVQNNVQSFTHCHHFHFKDKPSYTILNQFINISLMGVIVIQ